MSPQSCDKERTFTWISNKYEKSCFYSSDFFILWKIRKGTATTEYISDSMNGIKTGGTWGAY